MAAINDSISGQGRVNVDAIPSFQDITSMSLGIRCMNYESPDPDPSTDLMKVIIPKGTPYPLNNPEIDYAEVQEGAFYADIKIIQGESKLAEDC